MNEQSQVKKMAIAVDAMGGDNAPGEVVRGAVEGAKREGVEIKLVGTAAVADEIGRANTSGQAVSLLVTEDYVHEGEPPAMALRKKPKASIVLATRMVRTGEAAAVVSAGPTGSVMAAALGVMGLLEGIERPVMGGPFVGFAPKQVILDVGANVDCNPYHLLNFGVVGMVYARKFLNIENPSIALLSVGSEEGKGNEAVKEAYGLLRKSGLNFAGNVEGMDLLSGKANVVICDGFVGNILVKFCEGMGWAVNKWLRANLKGEIPEAKLEGLTSQLFKLTNMADTFGGGPILGANGVAVKAHGRSRAEEVARAIGLAKSVVESRFVEELKAELARVRELTKPQA